ncbi:MAG: hotdog fold thioesterase [Micromonosporaceae bacterium]|nr:hotdog fold thioesterase [Micromonosporaceae bacterium]
MDAAIKSVKDALSAPEGLAARLGIKLVELSPDQVVGTMPVAGNTQPYGLLHGGASCALAETLGSVGAMLHAARSGGGAAVGIEINATHHRSVREGEVTGVARAIHLGRTVATYAVEISDETGARVATARLTCLIRRT